MKRENRILISIGILFLALTDSGGGAAQPAMQAIFDAFPEVLPAIVQLVVTVPSLLLALTPILYAKLLDYGIRKRALIYVGAIFFVLGGVMPFFFTGSIWIVLLGRAIFGIGNGICLPLSMDLVIDYFEGRPRSIMQGFVTFMIGVSGVFFLSLGGYLSSIRWNYTFLSYAVSAVFFVVAIALIPEPDRQGKISAQEGITDLKKRAKITPKTYLIGFLYGLYFMLWMAMPTNTALVVVGEGIVPPEHFGAMSSLMAVCCSLFGLTFGYYFPKLKYAVLPLAAFICGVGLVLHSVSHSAFVIAISFCLAGASSGMMMPGVIAYTTAINPYSAGALAISTMYFFMGFMQFLQPIVFSFFGSYAIGRNAIWLGGIGLFVTSALMIMTHMRSTAYLVEVVLFPKKHNSIQRGDLV